MPRAVTRGRPSWRRGCLPASALAVVRLRSAPGQEPLEKRRNLWRYRREMDCKTTGAFRQGGHDLGIEIAREFFPMAAHELDLDVTPGLDSMVGAYLTLFGRQLYQTAGAYGIAELLPFEPRELQRDRLRQ